MKERRKYWKHRRKARNHKQTYLSMIIDGMDQSKTWLPRLTEETQRMQRQTKLIVGVTGVLVHGHGSYVYLTTEETPKDSNLTIEVLMRTLLQLPKPLPSVLYLQADNCHRVGGRTRISSSWPFCRA